MRSALALAALLLLQLLPPPSLAQDNGQPISDPDSSAATTNPPADPSKKDVADPSKKDVASEPVNTIAAVTTAEPHTDPTTSSPRTTTLPGQGESPVVAKDPAVTSATTSVVPTSLSTKQSVDSPAGPTDESQGSTKHPSSTLKPQAPGPEPVDTQTQKEAVVPGDQRREPATTRPLTTTVGKGTTSPPATDTTGTARPHPAPVATSPTRPQTLTAATTKATESWPQGPHNLTTVSSFTPTAEGTPSTPAPPGTPQGTQESSTEMPAHPVPPSSGTPPPACSPPAVVTTRAVSQPTVPSTSLAPTAPQSPSAPSPTLDHRNITVKCLPPEGQSEKLLILNLTEASPCAKGSPLDDRLVTLLCRAGKPTFDPARDWCDVQLAPVQGGQAVAIHKITIQTNLHPKDVYEVLKDKWDDLRDVGVSNMQLGNEGPPEEPDDRFSMPLIITIVCMASFLLLVAALYGCCHQRLSQRKDQQRLTEELQTVENGYHDNPTLEVMETSSEMQEKKVVNLNGELGDSWIVPLDNLTKDDLDEEEDTHL